MTAREPKSSTTTMIEVRGRPGGIKGRLELTSGNLIYYRAKAKTETFRLTYQQLLQLLENEIEFDNIDISGNVINTGRDDGDFTFQLESHDDSSGEFYVLFSSTKTKIKNLDPRLIDDGTYQFSDDMATGRKSKEYKWFAHVSIQVSLWIVEKYIDKFIFNNKDANKEDEGRVITRNKLRVILLKFLKKV